jgi:hypothetical protein
MKPIYFGLGLFLFPLALSAKPLTLGVIADLNGTECQTKYPANSITAYEQMLANHEIDHIISTGDAVHGECLRYKGGTPYQNVVRGMWEEFDRKFYQRGLEVEGTAPVIAPGNHDAPFVTASSRETFKAENAEFVRHWLGLKPHLNVEMVEVPQAADNYPYYWAYVRDNVLYVVLQSTSTHSLSNGNAQKEWLRAVLQSPQAKGARARIAYGHIPPYPVLDPSVGGKYSEIIDKEQVGKPNSLTDILLDNNVDLLVVGHSHAPYPAELTRKSDEKRMKILSMPCAHAPRKLYSKKEAAPRGYAIIELSDDNEISLSLHNWSDGKEIPSSYFPASIPLKDPKVSYQRLGNKR